MEKIDLSIVIVNFNTKELTINCVKSVLKHTKKINYEIIVVDNGSKDGSIGGFKTIKSNRVFPIDNKKNLGFSAGNNAGIKKSKGRYVLLLNSDTVVKDNVLGEMTAWMDKNVEVGIASCALRNEDGSLQGTGGYFPSLIRVISWMSIEDLPLVSRVIKPFHPMQTKSFFKDRNFYSKYREFDWLTGAFMFIRREVLSEIGTFDENYFMYTEDTDFCFRAKAAGWRVVYNPRWSIIHLGGKSSKTREFPILSEFKGIKTFYKKHYPKWQYPIAAFFLKFGALWRMVVLGILEGKEAATIYAKAYKQI